ncbi:MAG: hypothetical protein KAT71_00635, partial [Gammaproteobacteria bacterium]|nr:hypothetical protein [Gammaproteobacteria bacterium]
PEGAKQSLIPHIEKTRCMKTLDKDCGILFHPFRVRFRGELNTQGFTLGYPILPRWGSCPYQTSINISDIDHGSRAKRYISLAKRLAWNGRYLLLKASIGVSLEAW